MTRARLASAEDTERFGSALAARLRARQGLTVYLEGPLGAGKTALVRGALRALGEAGRVRSPTYTLLEPYNLADHRVVHLDLYRLEDAAELHALGLPDYAPDRHWWFIEWPERAGALLPPPDLRLRLSYDGDGRCVEWSGPLAGELQGLA